MKQRGMTLVEVLLALSLVSVLAMGSVSWLQTATSLSVDQVEPRRWKLAAEALLQLIEDDLQSGDLAAPDGAVGELPDRARLVPTGLEIRTRARDSDRGPILREYSGHAYRRDVTVRQRPDRELTRRSGLPVTKTLLEQVEDFDCSLDPEKTILSVSLVSTSGWRVSRRFPWPVANDAAEDPDS